MDRQKFAFDKTNFILLAIGMAVIIVGFLLMTGPSSTEGYFEPDIFSVRRIKVAPAVSLLSRKTGAEVHSRPKSSHRIKRIIMY